jgi:diguanylate cyclase (GGDEF)-like protein
LPNTDTKGALTLVKRINSSIIKLKTGGTKAEQVTVSVGLATCKGDKNAPFDQIIQEAEQAMKKAKAGGKNQIIIYDNL